MFVNDRDFDIEKIAASGQCFRMNKTPDGNWLCMASDRSIRLCSVDDGYEISCSGEGGDAFLRRYFDLETDYAAFRAAIDPSDIFLCSAAEAGIGIRILKQDPWEMLISFIISQRKNIPAIKAAVEALCRSFGEKTPEGSFAFPKPAALASASASELKACSLGYRVPYVSDAARRVDSGDLNLEALDSLDDASLMDALQAVSGVGPKVASCVSLFGYHRIGAFPVDVWIKRMLDEHYGGVFPLERYSGFAGVMQQYIFYKAISDKAG
ncbi:MAG TPA: DNA glycosylase [Bacillota bacterium]|nr:DNA glycosylase [Bacillota bacterium]